MFLKIILSYLVYSNSFLKRTRIFKRIISNGHHIFFLISTVKKFSCQLMDMDASRLWYDLHTSNFSDFLSRKKPFSYIQYNDCAHTATNPHPHTTLEIRRELYWLYTILFLSIKIQYMSCIDTNTLGFSRVCH